MEISLEKLLHIVKEKIWWIILVAIVGGLLSFSYNKVLVTPTYSSSIKMMVAKNEDVQTNLSDLSYAQYANSIARTYIAILNDKDFYKEVAATSDLDYTETQLSDMFKFSAIDETSVLQITVQASSGRETKILADTASVIIPKRLQNVYSQATIQQVSTAREGVKVGPHVMRNTVLGAIISAFLLVTFILLRDMMDIRIRKEEDLVEHYDLPVLGVIPNFSSSVSKRSRRK